MMKRCMAAILSVCMLCALSLTAFAAPADKDIRSAKEAAAEFLLAGSVDSDWVVMALSRAGKLASDSETAKAYLSEMQAMLEEEGVQGMQPTDMERSILALGSLGVDCTDFAGFNLVDALLKTDLSAQGVNAYIYGLLALDSRAYAIAAGAAYTREQLVTDLLALRAPDGGFTYFGDTSDPDLTAMGMQALAPYAASREDVREAVDACIALLSTMQGEDGNFPTAWSPYPASESTAQVISALAAAGVNPSTDARFVKNGVSIVDALLGFATENGGFKHQENTDADAMPTVQALFALSSVTRLADGQPSIYDYSDLVQQPEPPAEKPEQPVQPGPEQPVTPAPEKPAPGTNNPNTGAAAPVASAAVLLVSSAGFCAVCAKARKRG